MDSLATGVDIIGVRVHGCSVPFDQLCLLKQKNTSVYLLSVFKTLEVLTVEAPAMEKLLQLPLGSGLNDVESIRFRGNPGNSKGL